MRKFNNNERLRDITFLVIACLIHGAVLSANPMIHWGNAAPQPQKLISVEFVAAPPPTPALAPIKGGGDGKKDLMPRHGPGAYKPQQVKKPKTKFTAKRAQAGKKPPAKAKPKLAARSNAQRQELERKRAQQRLQAQALKTAQKAMAQEKAKEAARLKAERKAEQMRIAQEKAEKARQLAAQRAERARILAEEKAERDRKLAEEREQRARLLAEEKAEKQRKLAEERAERARLLAEEKAAKERQLAEERAERARKRAEISNELAAVADPDEPLADAANDPALAGRVARGAAGGAVAADTISAGPEVGPSSGRVAALPGSSEPVYELEAEGHDNVNSKASGGGMGPGAGGSSWTLEGPAGNRRIIKRILPPSPDWINKRSLELTVQIKFQVMEDGTIKHGSVIRKTSGFPEIDQLALEALKRWKFEAIPAKPGNPQVWGTVTFRFMMG